MSMIIWNADGSIELYNPSAQAETPTKLIRKGKVFKLVEFVAPDGAAMKHTLKVYMEIK